MFADSFCNPSSLPRSRRGWFTLASFALQALGLSRAAGFANLLHRSPAASASPGFASYPAASIGTRASRASYHAARAEQHGRRAG